jgi:cytochrome c biogenesis protein CcmG/thiol:disulfide interchange protein DsbE
MVAVFLLFSVIGCGSSGGGDYGGAHPDYNHALAGAPQPLAGLYRQANRVLPGGTGAFQARLRALRGHPVVVNKWASWCQPCRQEFPLLQKAAARYGKKVAFLGVDSEDSDAGARTFLREYPLPYPSYSDPSQDIAQLLQATLGFPATAYFDRSGKLVFVKQGQYSDLAELEADIRRHAIRPGAS